jgi:hydroxymethylpyrimidine/phosphomethylpyrimidine kinase
VLPTSTRRAACVPLLGALDPRGHAGLTAALAGVIGGGAQGLPVATAVRDLTALPERLVLDGLRGALAEAPVDAVLLGDPGAARLARAVAEPLGAHGPWIVDPELCDAHGEPRYGRDVFDAVRDAWLPHAEVLVVDAHEAGRFVGRPVEDLAGLREAGKRLFDAGVTWVVLTGGALEGHAIDLAYDGRDFTEFGADRRRRPRLAGAGAAFAGHLTARRAAGDAVLVAVEAAKAAVTAAIDEALEVGGATRTLPLAAALRQAGVDLTPIEVPPPAPDAP